MSKQAKSAKPAKELAKATPAAERISVTGPAAGRRRAGFTFTHKPTLLELAKLEAAQLAAIKADPMLKVETL